MYFRGSSDEIARVALRFLACLGTDGTLSHIFPGRPPNLAYVLEKIRKLRPIVNEETDRSAEGGFYQLKACFAQ